MSSMLSRKKRNLITFQVHPLRNEYKVLDKTETPFKKVCAIIIGLCKATRLAWL